MTRPTPVAIIGMGCRLPGGASSPEKLWQMLVSGQSAWQEIPSDRWNWKSFYSPYLEAKESVPTKGGYFLQEDISEFDARFFGIPAFEAQSMDPQQRILLETAYEALEDAGIPIEGLRGSDTSVYMGIFERDYDRIGFKDLPEIMKSHLTGAGDAVLSNRISYQFDLKGASMTIDTGCSGSLVALHQACHSLRSGESSMAIVGGSQILIHPDLSVVMSSVGLINPDGQCYPFDSRGQGYGRGEGVAAVILKTLDQAIKDGDNVHAVIANSGINQDGKTGGLSVPSGKAQAALMKRVYEDAGINPADTLYVEAHGTGTKVGDKEEVASISKVFCEDTGRESNLYVGSIKSNIGHLEACSGMAGLLKAVLVLKHNTIPPNLNLIEPKASLKLHERKVKIPLELTPLPSPAAGDPRRVSVNNFGYGGTNCHIILEALEPAPAHGATNGLNGTKTNGFHHTNGNAHSHKAGETSSTNGTEIKATPKLFVLSAASEKSLQASIDNLKVWMNSHDLGKNVLKDLSYTLAAHRSQLSWRRSIVASNGETLTQALEQDAVNRRAASSVPLAFVFTGQGAQWYAMGRELLRASECFQASIRKTDEYLRSYGCQWTLYEELQKSGAESRLGEAEISQPATTAIQVALVDLLSSLSITPTRVVGHSSGEIGAAYASGALSHEPAILSAYKRGLYCAMAKEVNAVRGSMMAVGLGEKEALPYIKAVKNGVITVACVNSPSSTTISGDDAAIDELKIALDSEGIFNRKLKVDNAYHSHHMAKIAEEYEASLGGMVAGVPQGGVKFFSSVTGELKTEGFGPDYWTKNLVSQVKFSQALLALRDDMLDAKIGGDAFAFVEIGPHSALAGPARQTLAHDKSVPFKYNYLSALVRNEDAVQTLLGLVGRLFELGYPVNLKLASDISGSHGKPRMITDLKPYPWDRSRHWHESRLSKAHRFRKYPYHDLCGLLDPMSNIEEPRWRYHINLDALPWLKDHVVDGFIIYPGAGYLCMAIEAFKQLLEMRNTPGTLAKFILRNIFFSKSIMVPEQQSDGKEPEVELQLVMSPSKTYEGSKWETFRIFSYGSDGSWNENCSGEISAEMKITLDEVEGDREANLLEAAALARLDCMKEECDVRVAAQEFYNDMQKSGNVWGPSFTILDTVHFGKNKGIVSVVVPDVAATMPNQFMQPHVIHPITLDASHQLSAMLFKRFCSNAPCVPTTTEQIEISADIARTPGEEIIAAMDVSRDGPKSTIGNSCLFQKGQDGKLKVAMRTAAVKMRAIGEASSTEQDVPFAQPMAHRVKWEVDSDFLTNSMFLDRFGGSSVPVQNGSAIVGQAQSPADHVESTMFLLEQAASIYLRDALRELESRSEEVTAPHLVKLFTWMKTWRHSDQFKEIMQGVDSRKEREILDLVLERAGVEGELLARVGQALPSILAGKTDPLALMLKDNLLNLVYARGSLSGDYEPMVEYLKMLSFKKPHMTFLEIGAGTGGATKNLLRGLTTEDGLMLDRYLYTDISGGFFEQARSDFEEWLDHIEFKTLDIEKDPVQQGFVEGSCDIVIASNVLHATENMDVTMSNVRKLLKPGGSLVLVEATRKSANTNAVYGTLPGWWIFEDGREDSPLMSQSEWNDLLLRHSFGGLHVARINMMVSKALEERNDAEPVERSRVRILKGSESLSVNTAATEISRLSHDAGAHCEEMSWENLGADPDTIYIVLDRSESPVLLNPSPELFTSLHKLFGGARNILWAGLRETNDLVSKSMQGLVLGTARVLRRENDGMRFITLNVETPSSELQMPDFAEAAVGIAKKCFWPATEAERSAEREFAYREGKIMIPRVQPDNKFLGWVHSGISSGSKLETVRYHQSERPLRLEVGTPGLLGTLRFVDDETLNEPLKPSDIQVSARCYGVNFKDVFIALGQMLPSVSMVGEVAGVVTAVGDDMHHLYKVGDRVTGLGAEAFASHARIKGYNAHRIPDEMPFTVAATIPTVYLTVYQCLIDTARLEKGQSILIHAASGGIGQAAIQFAQYIGAEIFATVGSGAKRKLLIDTYGIPDSHIFSSRSQSFKQGVLRLTQNEGVDVVLNSLSGETLRDSLACVKTLGTFVEIGKSDIYKRGHLDMTPFDKSITFAAVDLIPWLERHPVKMHEKFSKIMKMFARGDLYATTSINKYDIENIEEAFRLIGSRKHIGKVVLEAGEDAKVKATPPKAAPLQLRRDGTYVVAGGLGDVGKRMARFLAEHGAGHVVSLSRRDIDQAARDKFVDGISKLGAKLHVVKCDITDTTLMADAVKYCSQLPPVRGVVHGGMVLRDHPFDTMTLEDWLVPLQSKVHGTVNLDKAFASENLDFFITLSSVSCITGKSGQSNYAAGNAFQDTFAQAHAGHPHTQYISINVGAIEGSDSVTSVPNGEAGLTRNSAILISFEEFFKSVEYCMSPNARADAVSQSLLGFTRQSMIDASDDHALENPFFSRLPRPRQDSAAAKSEKVSVADALRASKTLPEAEALITEATLAKFAVFLDRPVDEIRVDQSLANIGLDSLVSIELKNWMVRTFQVTLQTSELAGAASILAISSIIAARSKLIRDEARANQVLNGKDSGSKRGLNGTKAATSST